MNEKVIEFARYESQKSVSYSLNLLINNGEQSMHIERGICGVQCLTILTMFRIPKVNKKRTALVLMYFIDAYELLFIVGYKIHSN